MRKLLMAVLLVAACSDSPPVPVDSVPAADSVVTIQTPITIAADTLSTSCVDVVVVNNSELVRKLTPSELVAAGKATQNSNGSITIPARYTAAQTLTPIAGDLRISVAACPSAHVRSGPNFPIVGQGSGQIHVNLSRVGGATTAYRLEFDQPVKLGDARSINDFSPWDLATDSREGLKQISADEFYQSFVISPGDSPLLDEIIIPVNGSGENVRVTVAFTSPSGDHFSAQAVLE